MVVFHTSIYVISVIKNKLPCWAFVNLFLTASWGESPWSSYLVCTDQFRFCLFVRSFSNMLMLLSPAGLGVFIRRGKGLFNNAALNWCVIFHSICIYIYIYSLSTTVYLIIIIRFSSEKERQQAKYAHTYTQENSYKWNDCC